MELERELREKIDLAVRIFRFGTVLEKTPGMRERLADDEIVMDLEGDLYIMRLPEKVE